MSREPLESRAADLAGLQLILASSSPRREALLAEAGYRFEIRHPTLSEEHVADHAMTAEELVCALAYYKAREVADGLEAGLVLGADTVVECEGEILGKPTDREDARRMLSTLASSRQRVLTGIALINAATGKRVIEYDVTTLKMRPMSDAQIESYLAAGHGDGKAGAYALQEGGDVLVEWMDGSESNVIGLPMEALQRAFAAMLATGDDDLHQLDPHAGRPREES